MQHQIMAVVIQSSEMPLSLTIFFEQSNEKGNLQQQPIYEVVHCVLQTQVAAGSTKLQLSLFKFCIFIFIAMIASSLCTEAEFFHLKIKMYKILGSRSKIMYFLIFNSLIFFFFFHFNWRNFFFIQFKFLFYFLYYFFFFRIFYLVFLFTFESCNGMVLVSFYILIFYFSSLLIIL